MEILQFDEKTEIVFKYILNHPKTEREMITCLDNYSNEEMPNRDYNYSNAFQDYAYTCIDYLLESGLIYATDKQGHTYYSVSAKGMAYLKYYAKNKRRESIPYVTAIGSLIVSVVSLVLSIVSFIIARSSC